MQRRSTRRRATTNFPSLLILLAGAKFTTENAALAQSQIIDDTAVQVSASRKALSRLEGCCLDPLCREENLSDLLSAVWNFAALPEVHDQAVVTAKKCKLKQSLREGLRKYVKCEKRRCVIQRAIYEFHARRYKLLLDTPVPRGFNETLSNAMSYVHNWKPSMLFDLRRKDIDASSLKEYIDENNAGTRSGARKLSRPSAFSVDHALVLGFAAQRAGIHLTEWTNNLIERHISKMRRFYNSSRMELGPTRSVVWMVMHILYVTSEFGFLQVDLDVHKHEVDFLLYHLDNAIARDDFDMLGEILDCLQCAGLAGSHPTIIRGTQHLLARQNSDGSWGDRDDRELVHICHVCGLALLHRSSDRMIGNFSSPLSNQAYWLLADKIMPPGRDYRWTKTRAAEVSAIDTSDSAERNMDDDYEVIDLDITYGGTQGEL